MKKTCRNCGEEFYGIRIQKYCSAYCRNQYHYKKVKSENKLTFEIDNILHSNRFVLKKVLGNKKSTIIFKINISALGFNKDYFTNFCETENGKTAFCCYEYGFYEIDSERFRVFINK